MFCRFIKLLMIPRTKTPMTVGVQGGTATAHKTGAANHNGCDHIELHADADHRGTNAGRAASTTAGFARRRRESRAGLLGAGFISGTGIWD